MEGKVKKPPLGIMPKKIWEENKNIERFNEVVRAISDRWHAGLDIPLEWVEEYNELNKIVKQ